MMNIPVVDLDLFVKGNAQQKQDFVAALGTAYEEVGFVAVKNHGIPDALIRDLYQYVQQFFSLPAEAKLHYEKRTWPASAATPPLAASMPKDLMRPI